MTLLNWCSGRREDRDALKAFTCTEPGKKKKLPHGWEVVHPRRWELEVQARIHRLHPPYPPNLAERLLLGWDEQGIGAVAFYQELDGPGQVEVYLAAVATRYRRRGKGWADELMKQTLDAITIRAVETGCDVVEVTALIHEQNRASQEMARRFRFRHTGTREEEPSLQQWSTVLQIAGAEYVDHGVDHG